MDTLTLTTFGAPQRPLDPHLDVAAPPGGWTFPPTSVTLIAGRSEAILVDALPTVADSAALADWLAGTGKTLTTIYVTHGHFDHYLGVAPLLERFPGVQVVATAATVRHIEAEKESGAERALYSAMFLDDLVPTLVVPEVLTGDRLPLEGHDVRAVPAGRSDHADSSFLHLPELAAVVVGDIAYNGVHCALVDSDHQKRRAWIETLEAVRALDPEVVVASHRRADAPDDARALSETIAYLDEADRLLAAPCSAADFVEAMLASHPTRLNAATVLFSAATLGLT